MSTWPVTGVALLAPIVAGLMASSGARAPDLPEAPPPHPALEVVLAEYRRLGLPLPPPDAELVRIRHWSGNDEAPYVLGFRTPPARPGERPRYLVGTGAWEPACVDPAADEPSAPGPAALHQVSLGGDGFLCLAAQCKARGWDALAGRAYTRARADLENDPVLELRWVAWHRWVARLTERDSDRAEVLRQLTHLSAEEPSFRTPDAGRLLRQLELTAAPRTAKPGSTEALIDGLTDYWVHGGFESEPGWGQRIGAFGHPAYRRLVELGFDAVPALIDHVADDRLTRAGSFGFNFRSAHSLTVGHLCSRLLFDLSGRTIGGGYWEARGDRLDPARAREWFATARATGEEEWLVTHALPPDGGGPIVNQRGRPEPHIVRVLGAKYPNRLPAVYRAVLAHPPSHLLGDFADEVAASRLPRERKAALLAEGAASDDFEHRWYALSALAEVDGPTFRKHLLATLERMRAARPGEGTGATVAPYQFVPLVGLAAGREHWDALAGVTAGAKVGDRVIVIREAGTLPEPGRADPSRRERLRFLLRFLDDGATDPEREDGPRPAVRDYSADRLALLFGFRLDLGDAECAWEDPPVLPHLAGFLYRVVLRRAAQQELTGPHKP
jgi:hypothetical protein